jgi:hypothetical protein
VAFCRPCNLSYKLSELTHRDELDPYLETNNPPPGAWFSETGMGIVTGATHRSLGSAFGLLLVSLFWNGIVSIFVLVAISGTLHQMNISIPHWFPAPNMNNEPMSLGMVLFLWIFLTPFIAIGLGMLSAFLSCLGGRTDVLVEGDRGVVFVGIGPLGFRRRFDASSVKEVRIDTQQWSNNNGQRKEMIVLETREGKKIKFATMLTEERRKFVAGALRKHFRI